MRDILKYSKKELIIGLVILLVLGTTIYFILNKQNKETPEVLKEEVEKIVLFGESEITLLSNEKYIEPGYYAITNFGQLKEDGIEVNNNDLDTTKPGVYYITYKADNVISKRKITVLDEVKNDTNNDTNSLSLLLNGNSMMVIDEGDKYVEPGYKSIDSKDGDLTSKVKVIGDVKEETGTYTLTYEISNSRGEKITKTRTVIVKEGIVNVSITGDLKTKTSNNINLTITITGNNFTYIRFPNGVVSENKVSNYLIEKNGVYKFLIYDNNYNYITKEISVTNIDKTTSNTDKVKLSGSCTATLKDGKTTFKVTSTGSNLTYNYNSLYKSNNSSYTLSSYSRDNNFVVISDKNGNQAKINCLTKMEALPMVNVTKEVKYKAESDTLKVKIVKDGGIYLSYIWAYDPVNQLRKQHTEKSSKIVKSIIEIATNNNNLKDKYLIGFNASPPVNSKYYSTWNKDSKYSLKEPLPLMLYNGKILVNDPKKGSELYIYYLDGSNQLKYTPKVSTLTALERETLYNEIIASGAKNTFTWRPILVDNYKAVAIDPNFLKEKSSPDRKQAICQINSNNFIIVTSENSSKGKITYPNFTKYLESLGCRVAMEFDAGGSTSLVIKSRGTNTVEIVTGTARELTSAMYFTEL